MKRILAYSLLALFSLGVIGVSAAAALIYWASRDLPNFSKIADYQLPLVTTVYARDKSIIAYFYKEKRFPVTLEQMPVHLRNAFISSEDANFFEHMGVDPKAIARAFINNLRRGTRGEGGSTITQQLIKRLMIGNERSYTRKLKEAILAYRLEKIFSKDQILTLYLNEIYLGEGAHGVEAAARTFFGKHVQELTLAESAALATLPKAPTTNNPYSNPIATKNRQRYSLERMLKDGWITQAEFDEAWAQPLEYKKMPEPSRKVGAWYVEEVRRRLLDMFSEKNIAEKNININTYGEDAIYTAGLHVFTAMEPVHQAAGEAALRQGLLETAKRQGWRGPIQHAQENEYADFLEKNPFEPAMLADAGWVKALVVKVAASGAEVRMGERHKGRIDVKTMSWCRTPNIKVAPDNIVVRDATKVLAPGDVVWVSAVGARGTANPVGTPPRAPAGNDKLGVPAYNPASVKPDTAIPLSLEQMPEAQGALVSMETDTGDVVALVGGYAYGHDSQFIRATQAKRQPGSSFKPIVYSAALDKGYTAASVVMDGPYVSTDDPSKTWRPANYDGTFLGPMILRTALTKSRNACTVRVAQHIGITPIIERARAFGMDDAIPVDLAVSLGAHAVSPLVMTEAYSAFASEGKRVTPRIITSVNDTWGEPLLVIDPETRQVITPQNAYIMTTLMKEVVNAGTATRAKVLGRPVAGKTGTSNEERDTWFIGYSPYLVTTVYTGHDQVQSLGRLETGSRTALPSFIYYRRAIDSLYPPTDFSMPGNITFADVDGKTGKLAGPNSTEAYLLPFVTGTEPKEGGSAVEGGEDILRNQLF